MPIKRKIIEILPSIYIKSKNFESKWLIPEERVAKFVRLIQEEVQPDEPSQESPRQDQQGEEESEGPSTQPVCLSQDS